MSVIATTNHAEFAAALFGSEASWTARLRTTRQALTAARHRSNPNGVSVMAIIPTIDGYCIGDRVQLHPATDAWMRGERFGEIVNLTRLRNSAPCIHVRLDMSGHTLRLAPDNILRAE